VADDAWREATPTGITWVDETGTPVDADVNPWGGYLVYAWESCAMVVPARALRRPARDLAAVDGRRSKLPTRWMMTLNARNEQGKESHVRVGAWSERRPRVVRFLAPPALDGPLALRLDLDGIELRAHLAEASDRHRWTALLHAAPGIHHLSWSIDEVPDGHHVYLIDRTRGHAVDLRTASRYTYRSSGESRSFEILVTREAWSGPLFTPPAVSALVAARPNPTRRAATIVFDVAGVEDVRVVVYDVMGRAVQTLTGGWHDPGRYQVSWDLRRDPRVAPGVYFVSFRAGNVRTSRKLVYLR